MQDSPKGKEPKNFFPPEPSPLDRLRRLDFPEERQDAIWENNLYRGCLHIVAGATQSGKSKILSLLISNVSAPYSFVPLMGTSQLLNSFAPVGITWICISANEDEHRIISGTQQALNPNTDKIETFTLFSRSLSKNLKALEEALEKVDPNAYPSVVAFDEPEVLDGKRGQEAAQALADFAKKYNIAILATAKISHQSNTPTKILGSLPASRYASVVFGILAISREASGVVSALVRIKSESGPRDEAFVFEIHSVPLQMAGGGIVSPLVARWTGEKIDGQFEQASVTRIDAARPTKIQLATFFIREYLGGVREASAAEVIAAGRSQGLSEDSVREAAKRIPVTKRVQPGVRGGRTSDRWALPEYLYDASISFFQQEPQFLPRLNKEIISAFRDPRYLRDSSLAAHAAALSGEHLSGSQPNYTNSYIPNNFEMGGPFRHPAPLQAGPMHDSRHVSPHLAQPYAQRRPFGPQVSEVPQVHARPPVTAPYTQHLPQGPQSSWIPKAPQVWASSQPAGQHANYQSQVPPIPEVPQVPGDAQVTNVARPTEPEEPGQLSGSRSEYARKLREVRELLERKASKAFEDMGR